MMDDNLRQSITDEFVRFAVKHNVGLPTLHFVSRNATRCKIKVTTYSVIMDSLMTDFCNLNQFTPDFANDFIDNFQMPNNRYCYNKDYVQDFVFDHVNSGDSVRFLALDNNDDKIDTIQIINPCNDIIYELKIITK